MVGKKPLMLQCPINPQILNKMIVQTIWCRTPRSNSKKIVNLMR